MTEAEAPKDTNGTVKEEPKDVDKQIIRQIEHYFGDYNLPKDRFLKEAMQEDEGWISVDHMLKFNRLAALSQDVDVILGALKKSTTGLMELDEEKKKIRRSPKNPLPEWNDEYKKKLADSTVYVKGFEKETTSLDDLIEFFSKFENVLHVNKRTYAESQKKGAERFFKGSVFVTFKDKESAEKLLESKDLKYKDTELIIKWQSDYFKEKDSEFEEKKKKRQEQRQNKKQAKEAIKAAKADIKEEKKEGGDGDADVKKEEVEDLPLGAVLCLDGFDGTETKREDIKKKLTDDFDVDHSESLAFIYFNKGDPSARIRFREENFAVELVKKMKENLKGEKLEINGAKIEFEVLEGAEEKVFLDQCKTDMQTRVLNREARGPRAHKRKGGFRGRGHGGKRGRR